METLESRVLLTAAVSTVAVTSLDVAGSASTVYAGKTTEVVNVDIGATGTGPVKCTLFVTGPGYVNKKVGSLTVKVVDGVSTGKYFNLPSNTLGSYSAFAETVDSTTGVVTDSASVSYTVASPPPVAVSGVDVSVSKDTLYPKNVYSPYDPLLGTATIDATGFGKVNCAWMGKGPDGKTKKLNSFTATIVNGNFTVKPFTGLPKTTIGSEQVWLQVTLPDKSVVTSNTVGYNVVAIPPVVVSSVLAMTNKSVVCPNGVLIIGAYPVMSGYGDFSYTWTVTTPDGKTSNLKSFKTKVPASGYFNFFPIFYGLPVTAVGDYKAWLLVTANGVTTTSNEVDYTVGPVSPSISFGFDSDTPPSIILFGDVEGFAKKDLSKYKVVTYADQNNLGSWSSQPKTTIDSLDASWTLKTTMPDDCLGTIRSYLLPKSVTTPLVNSDGTLPAVLDSYPHYEERLF